ncbi:MAG: hypothetical protein SGI72_16350 [Planctomycetota bacterium]|nr:hypothetical protein [Planctomycetota bacterium]
MSLSTITTLTLAALAAVLAWVLGGTLGTGVLAGFICGATVAGLVLCAQQQLARAKPAYVVHAVLAGFLAKASVMLVLTLVVRYVPAIEARCSPVSFLIAYAVTALAILAPATIDTLRLLGRSTSVAPLSQSHGSR